MRACAHHAGGSGGGDIGGPVTFVGPSTGHAAGSMADWRVTIASALMSNVVRSWAIVTGPSYWVRMSAYAGPTTWWSTARCHITDIRAPARANTLPAAIGLVWAPLMAELLACEIAGEPLPVEGDLAASVDPARFVARQQQVAR